MNLNLNELKHIACEALGDEELTLKVVEKQPGVFSERDPKFLISDIGLFEILSACSVQRCFGRCFLHTRLFCLSRRRLTINLLKYQINWDI